MSGITTILATVVEVLTNIWLWIVEWWWAIGLGWLLLAAVTGLIVGRVIRNRDKQIPVEKAGVQGMQESEKGREVSGP